MSKRFLIILIVILLLIALAGGLFFWLKLKPTNIPPPPTTPPTEDLSGFPVAPPLTNPEPEPTSTPPDLPLPNGNPDQNGSETPSILTRLSATSVSGATLLDGTMVYLEEETGNLFQTTNGQDNKQLTKSVLPTVAKAWWGRTKDTLTLIAQYLNPQGLVTTFRGTYNLKTSTSTEPVDLVGATIPNVSALGVAISPNRERQVSLLTTPSGVTGVITELATGKVQTLFTSSLKNWLVAWPAPTVITLSPRASAGVPGWLYFLNPNTGVLTRVLADQPGLTTLVNPAGSKLIYNRGLGDLRLYSVKDSATTLLTVATLPEKCVWASDAITLYCAVPTNPPPAQYPDTWWSGEVSFNDSFWQVNTETGEAKIILASQTPTLDAINPILDEGGDRLIFIDKLSGQLWSLDLQ